jgi:hypothetical protein
MAFRFTKKDVEGRFEMFAHACGKRIATSYNDVGAWRLDENTVYGGWNIEEIHNKGGGVSHPFGPMRHKSSEFVAMMSFAMDAIAIAKKKRR